jgi:hypothetical protein
MQNHVVEFCPTVHFPSKVYDDDGRHVLKRKWYLTKWGEKGKKTSNGHQTITIELQEPH